MCGPSAAARTRVMLSSAGAVLAILVAFPQAGAMPEFVFASESTRAFVAKVRRANGLQNPVPVSLAGTMERGSMITATQVVMDIGGRYKRGGATLKDGPNGPALSGQVTHYLDGGRYWQTPDPGEAIAAIARPRLVGEFDKQAVTLALHPPASRTMRVAVGPIETFNGHRARLLEVMRSGERLCTLYFATTDAALLGWTTVAETSIGDMPRVAVVERSTLVAGMRLPVVIRERTGSQFGSVTRYTRVLVGEPALEEFRRP